MMLFALAAILEAIFLRIALLGDLKPRAVETIGLLLLSGLFYLVCTFTVLRDAGPGLAKPAWRFWGKLGQGMGRGPRPALVLGAALIFRLTLWPLYPALSDDVFRYRWEGKLQASGGNPYEVRPHDPEWKSLRDEAFTSIPGRDFRAVYGPLMEGIELLTYRVVSRFEPSPFAQAFWFKAPSALFDLGVVGALWLLLRVKQLPAQRILIYAWCPLPLIEFWGNGHNDSIPVFFVVLALAAAGKNRWIWAFT